VQLNQKEYPLYILLSGLNPEYSQVHIEICLPVKICHLSVTCYILHNPYLVISGKYIFLMLDYACFLLNQRPPCYLTFTWYINYITRIFDMLPPFVANWSRIDLIFFIAIMVYEVFSSITLSSIGIF
jgi:hypothetical protein